MDGFRFTCLPGCTRCCCTQGFVYLTEADLRRAAVHLGMGTSAFEAQYVYRTRHLLRLRKPRHSQCPFLNGHGCGVHPAKPAQCRAYPFWPELLANRRAWRQAARACPGIGQGPLVQIETALRIAAEMREAYPGIYK